MSLELLLLLGLLDQASKKTKGTPMPDPNEPWKNPPPPGKDRMCTCGHLLADHGYGPDCDECQLCDCPCFREDTAATAAWDEAAAEERWQARQRERARLTWAMLGLAAVLLCGAVLAWYGPRLRRWGVAAWYGVDCPAGYVWAGQLYSMTPDGRIDAPDPRGLYNGNGIAVRIAVTKGFAWQCIRTAEATHECQWPRTQRLEVVGTIPLTRCE